MISRSLFIVFLVVILGFTSRIEPAHDPMFFNMSQEFEDVKEQEVLFTFTTKDTAVIHELQLLSNAKGQPLFYYSDIETPVCADGECKLAKLKVYWNLLGNYVGFGVNDREPLTKNEHDPFTAADYKKLHQLLGDRHSVLERREMDDLIDEVPITGEALKTYKGVDAISGATKKEIKESVVKGGLYSCYTLWHLVHGEVITGIKSHLQSMNSSSLTEYFLRSPYADYQEFGLKKINSEQFEVYHDEIINIFKSASPMTRAYILKKIPNTTFSEQTISKQFYALFSSVDMNTRTQLLQKMDSAPKESSLLILHDVELMTKNQVNIYLAHFEQYPSLINSEVKKTFKKYARSKDFQYSYLLKDFIAAL